MNNLGDILKQRGIHIKSDPILPLPKVRMPSTAPVIVAAHSNPRIHNVQQGSTEWLQLRAGIPTASSFDKIITPKGEPSKSAERYLYTLLAERCMGHPITEHISEWMQRGSEMEADAVKFYELQADADTETVGFITNEEGTIGASPDRLVGADGLLEIKVPSEWIHMGYLLKSGSAYDAYKIQVQGQLWITGRQFVDVLSWHPELPQALTRISRDEEFIEKLSAAVTAFSIVLEQQWREIAAKGWVATPKAKAESKFPHLPPLEELLKSAAPNGGQGGEAKAPPEAAETQMRAEDRPVEVNNQVRRPALATEKSADEGSASTASGVLQVDQLTELRDVAKENGWDENALLAEARRIALTFGEKCYTLSKLKVRDLAAVMEFAKQRKEPKHVEP